MKEDNMQIFVDIVKNFFNQLDMEEVVIDTPYLLENDVPKILEYTGMIGISGAHKGVVYVTASRELLKKTLECMGEPDDTETNIIDLVGEIANTISGNARKEFGADFHISVPVVFQGAPKSMILPKDERSFVIPIEWHSQVSEIVICVKSLVDNN